MSRGDYYRQQALLLLTWALATNDPDYAARLEARACMLLAAAHKPEAPAFHDLTTYVDELNNQQTRNAGRCCASTAAAATATTAARTTTSNPCAITSSFGSATSANMTMMKARGCRTTRRRGNLP